MAGAALKTPNRLPVVAIVGRPNVGKSTLFNQLTRTRDALVADRPGVTRDRIYGRAQVDGREIVIVDTGGLAAEPDELETRAAHQVEQALEESDVLIFMVDARAGINAQDQLIATGLRRRGLPIVLAVNKTDGLDPQTALAEASELAVGEAVAIAASHRRGLDHLQASLLDLLPPQAVGDAAADEADGEVVRLALIGRPNTGKSTLLNRLAGTERALAIDMPGTTRDPVSADIRRDGRDYRIVDTAGIRRRSRVSDAVEKFSVIKALQSIENAHIVVLLTDAREGLTDQDASLLGHVLDAGRGLVVAINKWDGLSDHHKRQVLGQIEQRFGFADFARVVTISALHGTGLRELFRAIDECWRAATRTLPTSALSRALEKAVGAHPPPSSQRFVPKLRYAHAGGNFPTRIVVHGNRTRHLPDSYQRYLANRFRDAFDLRGVPVRLVFRDSDNPYAGRRNVLTRRQLEKRKRLKKRLTRRR